jgi:phosphatidylserine/phosphatidylglycerophosphate/cardiolipin synthase-like enzyme
MKHILRFPLSVFRRALIIIFIIIVVKTGLHLVSLVEWYIANHSFLSIPPTFGKTHFIVGQDHHTGIDPHNQVSAVWSVAQQSSIKAVFFSPDDKVRTALVDLIQQEQERMCIAVFMLTDKKIAQALLRAYQKGVAIEIITDPGCLKDQYNKIGFLSDQGLSVFVYNPQHVKGKFASIMHNKFAIFKKNKGNKSILWTGSFNFTCAAHKCNQENVLVLDDGELVQRFVTQFERLKTLSYQYKPTTNHSIVVSKR